MIVLKGIYARGKNNPVEDVKEIQRRLNREGAGLVVDGIYGANTEDAVMAYQQRHGLKGDGIVGPLTIPTLPDSQFANSISDKAVALIMEFEGCAIHPEWPEGESGITIGYGYDLGYEGTLEPWVGRLSADAISRLSATLGVTGRKAHAMLSAVRDVVIPSVAAKEVFEQHTLPTECEKTKAAFPGCELLHPDVFGALVSVVYNRGAGMAGDSRREMREIRDCVARMDVRGIGNEIRRMKRLWPNVRGLQRRRDAEADMVLATLREAE